jgi:hypothetical protein
VSLVGKEYTPLSKARELNNIQVIELLLKAGAEAYIAFNMTSFYDKNPYNQKSFISRFL